MPCFDTTTVTAEKIAAPASTANVLVWKGKVKPFIDHLFILQSSVNIHKSFSLLYINSIHTQAVYLLKNVTSNHFQLFNYGFSYWKKDVLLKFIYKVTFEIKMPL